MAQDIRVDDPPSTISVKTVAVRPVGNNGNDWRAGLGFPVLSLRNGREEEYPTVASIDAWVLSDAKDFRRVFLGAGLDVPLLERKHMRVGLVGGWSADFANLEQVRDGRWGVGASLTIRF